jgi:hypothetical protein
MRLDADLPESFVHPLLAPGRPLVRPGEEVRHRLREITQRLLLHRLRPGPQPPELGAGLGQLPGLLVVVRCPAPSVPGPEAVLLDRQIPHIPGVRAMPEQGGVLLGRGGQTVTRHEASLTCTLEHRSENVLDSAWSTQR